MNTASLQQHQRLAQFRVLVDAVLDELLGFGLGHSVICRMQNRRASDLDGSSDEAKIEEAGLSREPGEFRRDADVFLARSVRDLNTTELRPVDRNVAENFVDVLCRRRELRIAPFR